MNIDVTTATHINVGGTWHRIYGGTTRITNINLTENGGINSTDFGACIQFYGNGGDTITAPITHIWAIRHQKTGTQ